MAAGRSSRRIRLALCRDVVLKNSGPLGMVNTGPAPSRPCCETSTPFGSAEPGRPRCSEAALDRRDDGRFEQRVRRGVVHPPGGPWLYRTLVWSGFQAVVVPSGFSSRVQPQRWMTIWWW